MSGPLIAVVTAIVLLGSAFLLALIPKIFDWLKGIFDRSGLLGKILIIIPLLALGILSIASGMIVFVIAILTIVFVANSARDWWNKR